MDGRSDSYTGKPMDWVLSMVVFLLEFFFLFFLTCPRKQVIQGVSLVGFFLNCPKMNSVFQVS